MYTQFLGRPLLLRSFLLGGWPTSHVASGRVHSRGFSKLRLFQMPACLGPLPPGYTYTKEHVAPVKVTTVVSCGHRGSSLFLKCAGIGKWLRNTKVFLLPSQSICLVFFFFFTCRITLAGTPRTLLRSDGRRHPCLTLGLGGDGSRRPFIIK